jgi:hypothetical protein
MMPTRTVASTSTSTEIGRRKANDTIALSCFGVQHFDVKGYERFGASGTFQPVRSHTTNLR